MTLDNKEPFTVQGNTPVDAAIKFGEKSGSYIPDQLAEPQDEWGPWKGWNGGECPVDGLVEVAFTHTHSQCIHKPLDLKWNDVPGAVIAYRIKKEPVSKEYDVCFNGNSFWNGHGARSKPAIITITDGKPSIAWVDDKD